MIGFGLALVAGFGVYYVYTATAFGWRGLAFGPATPKTAAPGPGIEARVLARLDLADVRFIDLAVVVFAAGAAVAAGAWLMFAGPVPTVIGFIVGGSLPVGAARNRRQRRSGKAREAWPRMIEEIRLLISSGGQSVPQALFTVGARAPDDIRQAFERGHREWLISVDFDRSVAVLKEELADPTADAALETLLIAHQIGGTDVDARLEALVNDRIQDLQGRKDASSKQAGARFARWFVLGVPLGMAAVGMSIGPGREAYATPFGQVAVIFGLSLMGACWIWAGRMMMLPEERRVFG